MFHDQIAIKCPTSKCPTIKYSLHFPNVPIKCIVFNVKFQYSKKCVGQIFRFHAQTFCTSMAEQAHLQATLHRSTVRHDILKLSSTLASSLTNVVTLRPHHHRSFHNSAFLFDYFLIEDKTNYSLLCYLGVASSGNKRLGPLSSVQGQEY